MGRSHRWESDTLIFGQKSWKKHSGINTNLGKQDFQRFTWILVAVAVAAAAVVVVVVAAVAAATAAAAAATAAAATRLIVVSNKIIYNKRTDLSIDLTTNLLF